MKTYIIIKVGKKEICYRVYSSKTGKGIEVINGTDPIRCESVREFYGWWHFDPVKEARRLYHIAYIKSIKKSRRLITPRAGCPRQYIQRKARLTEANSGTNSYFL